MTIKLSKVTLFNATAAATGTAFQCDWQNDGQQNRSIITTLANGADSVDIQTSFDGGTTWVSVLTAPHTGATTPFLDRLAGPYDQLRVVKTGSAGNALVLGLI